MKLARAFTLFVAALSLTLGLLTGSAAQTGGQIDELVRAWHIIFIGQVVKLRAANLKVLLPTENTVLVRVSEVLDVPPSVASLKGEQVTIQMARPGDVKQGDTEVFFTNALLFGEHLAVKEVGHVPVPASTAELRQQISAVRAQIEDEKLKARVDGAALIISGKVTEVKPLGRIGPRRRTRAGLGGIRRPSGSRRQGILAGENHNRGLSAKYRLMLAAFAEVHGGSGRHLASPPSGEYGPPCECVACAEPP